MPQRGRVVRYTPYAVAARYSGVQRFARAARPYARSIGNGVRKFVRRIRRDARDPKSVSSLKRKIGPMNGPTAVSTKRRKTVVQDEGGYTQFKSFKYKSGKKRSLDSKRKSILNCMITRQRFRFSAINELSAGQGYYFLKHGADDATFDKMPLYVFNLTNVRQGNTAFTAPFYGLRINTVTGSLVWNAVNGLAPDGTTAVTDWYYEDNEGSPAQVGRKSFLDWARIRLNMWGKKTAPARIILQIVSLPDEEYCPEFQATGTAVSKDADMFWKSQLKPLINNPCSSNVLTVTKRPKVHRQWEFMFDPESTTESDTDPHCKFFDFFYRIGRTIDYTVNQGTTITSALLDSASAYYPGNTANLVDAGTTPRYLNKSLYLVIKSMQQDKISVPTNSETASFDMNIQVCHRTVQPFLT